MRCFAEAVTRAGRAQVELVAAVATLRAQWERWLAQPGPEGRRLRSDSAAWRILPLLGAHLTLTAPRVATELGIPTNSALAALERLSAAGVLTEHGVLPPTAGGRPGRLFISPELLGFTGTDPLSRR